MARRKQIVLKMEKKLIKKICTKCGDPKLLEDYYPYDNGKYLRPECKECSKKIAMEYFRTKEGLVSRIYSHQRASSKSRGHSFPDYTNQELKDWMFSQPRFHELYEAWVASGYKTELRPSCDRSDDYKSYTLDNLQIMTWVENKAKGNLDRKNGVNNKTNKAVVGTSVVGGKEISFYSMAEAGRQTGINFAIISACCRGERKTTGGYSWRYFN